MSGGGTHTRARGGLVAAAAGVLLAVGAFGVEAAFGWTPLVLWLALLGLGLPAARRLVAAREPGRRVIREIRSALARHELELHYQPKILVATGEVCGVEALIRWRRDGEIVGPHEFLPQVERSELIGPFTSFVLDEALAQAARWKGSGHRLAVAVNLSGANLLDPSLAEQVATALQRHGVDADQLTLEVTETAVVDDHESAGQLLHELAALGVRLSVDDFGTGYSTLARIASFPVEEVKIDRMFVSQGEQRLLPGMVKIGRELGLRVVAEGVEDTATLDALRTLGCDAAQGFLWSPPVPAEELEQAFGLGTLRPRLDYLNTP